MSITSAFVSSRSGLAATGAWSEVTANNIANADRAGYVRRGLLLTSGPAGSGVQVTGLRREVDGALDRMHRQEMSRTATQDALAGGLKVHAALLGQPGDPLSIPGRLTALQSRLDQLSNDPSEPSLQRAALDAAAGLAAGLNGASATLAQTAAAERDGVARDVATLNALLAETADLNRQIALAPDGSRERAALEDRRGAGLDAIAGLVDIRLQQGPDGAVAIHTAGGTPLVEGRMVHAVAFDAAAGRLSAGGADITPGVAGARGFAEGAIAGRITLLNAVLPRMQLQLDETARMLVQSFAAADSSVAPGAPGLFTDAGGAFDPAATAGLAARLSVNPAVRGPAGDVLWRMRDGMGAAAPGPESDNRQIEAMIAAFATEHALDPAAGLGAAARITGVVPAMIADQQVARSAAQERADALRAGAQTLETARLSFQGVNVDDELQQLAAIEQSYAANAVMMRTLTEMLDTLLAAA